MQNTSMSYTSTVIRLAAGCYVDLPSTCEVVRPASQPTKERTEANGRFKPGNPPRRGHTYDTLYLLPDDDGWGLPVVVDFVAKKQPNATACKSSISGLRNMTAALRGLTAEISFLVSRR